MPDRPGWSDDFATSNPVIDNLHKEIFKRANILIDNINTHSISDNEIKESVDFLSDYVVEHFAIEEALQKLYRYPAFGTHKEKHDRFTLEIRVLKEKYEAGLSSNIAVELISLIVDRLMDDLEMEDKAFADYIKKMAA